MPDACPPRLLAGGSGGYRALTIGIVLSVSLAGFEGLGITTAMPAASEALDGDALYGWAFSAFQLCIMVATVVSGAIADRLGPARPLAVGLATFAAGLLLGTIAPTMWVLVVSRGITGLGAGAIFNLNFVLIGRAYPDALRSRMLALASAAWVLPGLVGPSISGWVADHLNWRWVFGGLLPAVPVIAMMVLPVVRRMGGEGSPTLPLTGERFWDATPVQRIRAVVVLAVGAGLVLGGLSASRLAAAVPFVIVGVAVAGRPLIALVPSGTRCARHGLPAITAGYFLLMGTFVGTESFLPLAFERSRDVSSTAAGLILTAGTLTWTLGSWLQSKDPGRWANGRLMALGALALTAGVSCALMITFSSVPSPVAYVGWAAGGIGMGLVYNSLGSLTYQAAAEERIGVATGATGLMAALGSAVAAGVSGALLNVGDRRYGDTSVTGVRWIFLFEIVLGLLTAITVLRAGSASRSPPAPASPVSGSPASASPVSAAQESPTPRLPAGS